MKAFLLSLASALFLSVHAGAVQGEGREPEADRAYAYIAGLAEKGMSDMVVQEAQAFLAAYPRHAKSTHARYRLGVALLDLGKTREAEQALGGASGSSGDNGRRRKSSNGDEGPAAKRDFEFVGEANARLARCRLVLGDAAGAESAATRALEWGQPYLAPLALLLRADARSAQADWNGARTDYEAALEKEPKGDHAIDAKIGLSWCALRGKDAAEGARRARELLDDRALPAARADEVRCLLGECALDAGDHAAALKAFRGVRDPALADTAARGAGFALAAAGDHKGAAQAFARVVEEHPQSALAPECALRCGIERLAAGDAAGARAVLSSKVVVADAQSMFWRARAELESGDAEAALATLDRARADFGRASGGQESGEWKARIDTARGAALEKLGRSAEAARAYRESGSIDGLQASAAASLAEKKFDEATKTARAAVALDAPPDKIALAWLTLGEARLGAQDWAEAEKAFLSAAKIDPEASRAARAKLRAGWCRFLAGDPRGARKLFDDAARGPLKGDEVEEASFLRARAAEASGERGEAQQLFADHVTAHPRGAHALEACVRLARLAPDEPAIALLEGVVRQERVAGGSAEGEWAQAARFDLAERLSAKERFDEAAARYAEVVTAAPRTALASRARYGLAWCAFSRKSWDDSARVLDEMLADRELDPALRAAATELHVWTAVRSGDASRALAVWKSAGGKSIDAAKRATLARELVDLLRKADRSRDAQQVLAELESSDDAPTRAWAAAQRVRMSVESGDLDGAGAQLEALSRSGSGDAATQSALLEAAFALAEARFAAGDAAGAIPLYDRVGKAKDSPLADRALYKAGFARLRAQDAAGAERDFARLIDSYPKSVLLHETLFLRAEALYRLDRLDESIALLERVRKEAPDHAVTPKVLFRLGLACCRQQKYRESADALDLLARRWPQFENMGEAELWRGRALAGTGDTRGARAAFERTVARGEKDGASADRARIELGKLAAAQGDNEGALAAFLKVAVLSGDVEAVPEALWNAGETLERMNQPDRAIDRYKEIVAGHAKSAWSARAQERLDALSAGRPATTPPKKSGRRQV